MTEQATTQTTAQTAAETTNPRPTPPDARAAKPSYAGQSQADHASRAAPPLRFAQTEAARAAAGDMELAGALASFGRGATQANRARRRWAVAAVAFVALVGLAYGVSRWELARRKTVLRRAIDREHAALPERPRAMVDAMDAVMLEAAAEPWPGDLGKPDPALFSKTMLFVRAAVPEIARLDAIGVAVRRGDKDTFALCAVKPPASAAPDDVHVAATRYWLGGALFDDATHDVLPLNAVHAGLRPLSRAYAAELDEADDHLSLRRLEEEYDYRKPIAISLSRTAADAERLVVVADELPPDMPAPEVGRSLTATRRPAILPSFEDKPHTIRVVVWSADTRSVVLRLRVPVDARSRPSTRRPEAWSEMHGCQAALAARGGS